MAVVGSRGCIVGVKEVQVLGVVTREFQHDGTEQKCDHRGGITRRYQDQPFGNYDKSRYEVG